MRKLVFALWVLAAVLVVVWVLFVFWAQGLACAFATSGNCRLRWPWQMSGEDLRFMVLIPGMMVGGLAGGAWLIARDRVGAGLAVAGAGLAQGIAQILAVV